MHRWGQQCVCLRSDIHRRRTMFVNPSRAPMPKRPREPPPPPPLADESSDSDESEPEVKAPSGGGSKKSSSSSSSSSGGPQYPKPKVGLEKVGDSGTYFHEWDEHLAPDARHRFRHGGWSKAEDREVIASFDAYCLSRHLLTEEDKLALLTRTSKDTKKREWLEIAQRFRFRTVRSVMRRARRLLSPDNYQGKFSKEEKAQLLELYDRLGPRWRKIGEELKRIPETVHTICTRLVKKRAAKAKEAARLRESSAGGGEGGRGGEVSGSSDEEGEIGAGGFNVGPWKPKEDERLVRAVKRLGHPVNKGYKNIPWKRVAGRVATRSPEDCTARWGMHCMKFLGHPWDASLDKLLVEGIMEDGGEFKEDVNWGAVVEGWQPGPVKAQWDALLKKHPRLSFKKFAQQVVALSEELEK